MPAIEYEWNEFLLRSIIDSYLPEFRIIEPRTRDRRFERGVIVKTESNTTSYVDLIINVLSKNNITEISENKLHAFLIANDLSYKVIPKDLFVSEQIKYEDNLFEIKSL